MTAPGPLRPTPGSAAFVGRPAGALWVLLLIGFLVGLPCTGSAHAATPPTAPPAATKAAPPHARHAAPHTAQAASRSVATPPAEPLSEPPSRPMTLCTADGPAPRPSDGCSSHPFSTQDAQLPNAPPHPVPAALPQLVTLRATPAARTTAGTPGPAPSPDLHLLQVNRT
ncbi:hypothetical protein P3T37_001860 [Kitasatospora sp. MAA4]|uniref:hypothetical protein n=1 Tax=Kitasatospora sp. MAA4 TaxID=3035093 RepID=UPI0024732AB3|nr:hypothetical protein [Kitasatospora sp. MAA4]MDH6132475.1 hypothetical protein [Kitasatospora sp. MAA4]